MSYATQWATTSPTLIARKTMRGRGNYILTSPAIAAEINRHRKQVSTTIECTDCGYEGLYFYFENDAIDFCCVECDSKLTNDTVKELYVYKT